MNTRNIGMAVVELGGGRMLASDTVDYSVGFSEFCHIGDKVETNRPIAYIHAKNQQQADEISAYILRQITITEIQPQKPVVILEIQNSL